MKSYLATGICIGLFFSWGIAVAVTSYGIDGVGVGAGIFMMLLATIFATAMFAQPEYKKRNNKLSRKEV